METTVENEDESIVVLSKKYDRFKLTLWMALLILLLVEHLLGAWWAHEEVVENTALKAQLESSELHADQLAGILTAFAPDKPERPVNTNEIREEQRSRKTIKSVTLKQRASQVRQVPQQRTSEGDKAYSPPKVTIHSNSNPNTVTTPTTQPPKEGDNGYTTEPVGIPLDSK